MKKVEIVIEAAGLNRMIRIVEEAGATGYTVIPAVIGKGRRGLRDEAHVSDVFRNALVIVVTSHDVARRIVDTSRRLLDRYAGILFVSDVEVPDAERHGPGS